MKASISKNQSPVGVGIMFFWNSCPLRARRSGHYIFLKFLPLVDEEFHVIRCHPCTLRKSIVYFCSFRSLLGIYSRLVLLGLISFLFFISPSSLLHYFFWGSKGVELQCYLFTLFLWIIFNYYNCTSNYIIWNIFKWRNV